MKKNIGWVVLLVAIIALAAVVANQRLQIVRLQVQPPAKVVTVVTNQAPAPPAAVVAAPPAQPTPAAPKLVTTAPVVSSVKSKFLAGLADMMKNPQMRAMMRAQQEVMINRTYGALAKILNLPEAQQAALTKLLSDRQMTMAEAGISAMSSTPADQKQVAEVMQSIKTDYDAQIQQLLGAHDYQTFQDYEKTTPERVPVQMFKDSLSSADAMTEQQESALVAAMYEERKALPAPGMAKPDGFNPQQFSEDQMAQALKQSELLQQRYASRAATILTPAQLEQFTKFQKQMHAMQEVGMKISVQMFGGQSSSPNK